MYLYVYLLYCYSLPVQRPIGYYSANQLRITLGSIEGGRFRAKKLWILTVAVVAAAAGTLGLVVVPGGGRTDQKRLQLIRGISRCKRHVRLSAEARKKGGVYFFALLGVGEGQQYQARG